MGQRSKPSSDHNSALTTRQIVTDWLFQIFHKKRSLDEVLLEAEQQKAWRALEGRDKAFARTMVMSTLRHRGEVSFILDQFLEKKPQPRSQVYEILLLAAVQFLILDVAPYAAIDVAVRQAKSSDKSRHLAKLVNAVLRRVSEKGPALFAKTASADRNIPPFLMARWRKFYGDERALSLAAASLAPAALDLAPKGLGAGQAIEAHSGDALAQTTGGVRLFPGQCVRLLHKGVISDLPGFQEGLWWVQDFAAQLPAQLFGDVRGKSVLDLCAAPGGKTAALLAGGAVVTALDQSAKRLERLSENLKRLNFQAEIVAEDVLAYQPLELFDAVLLDAPCSATGTIRRHPDILHLKTEAQIADLADLQARLLSKAATFLKPGGTLIYCTCSLEPEEGEAQIQTFLQTSSEFVRRPIEPEEVDGQKEWLTAAGDLRLLPDMSPRAATPLDEGLEGMDGFFIARLKRQAEPN